MDKLKEQELWLMAYFTLVFWCAGTWMIYGISVIGGWSESVMPKDDLVTIKKIAKISTYVGIVIIIIMIYFFP